MDAEVLRLSMPYYVCAVASLGTSVLCIVTAVKRLRPPWVLLLAVGFLLLGMGFYLIAITAAPGGHVSRATVGDLIRWCYLVGGLLWTVGLLVFVRNTVAVRR